MTGQADALAGTGARRRKRKNIRLQGPDAPRPTRLVSSPADLERPLRAGWRVIAAKEFADYVTSIRFLVLGTLMALAAAAAVYTTGGILNSVAQNASGNQSLFLALFAPPQSVSDANQIPPFTAFVTFLGPLLGIAFGFDAINGERSEATLPRLLAQPIHRDDVINGKFVASLSAIGLLLAVIMFIVSAVGIIKLGITPSAEDVLRLIVWWILALAYIGFWLGLALLCSVLIRRAATSALVALGVWLILTIFFGLIIGIVAALVSPIPSNASQADPARTANLSTQVTLGRLSPNQLFGEATALVLNPRLRTTSIDLVTPGQADLAVPGVLSLDQSLLVIWPQFVALVGVTMVAFGIAYVAFMRQEVRA